MNLKLLLLGILFAASWASASAAAKFGLRSVEPLVLFQVRFLVAGLIMLAYAFIVQKDRWPKGKEWWELTLFGLLNVTLYLSFFVLGIKEVAAGIGSLSTATNPLFISIISAFWMGRQVKGAEWLAVLLGLLGVALATYPLLQKSFATPLGIFYMFLSMVSYSVGTIYYSKIDWKLSRTAINGWQVFLGGLLMLPLTFLLHKEPNNYDLNFTLSVLWLIFPVSILAVQLWLYLLEIDPVKASFFLFLCPIFGFIYAYILLDEPISSYTFSGTALVIAGLYLGQLEKISKKSGK
ncbi:DMT family transporter [Emticicia sp. BO119]|uniref:DMT family transporter n=1 Tax=Emticicia sp. BO119 TaxID=2757768 RepID=UPI0015EFECCA|nr:DMT family transporter [Emticicia sp. BO119]MBA4854035.1 DMT family transporter [Emticicia sp. BO119]